VVAVAGSRQASLEAPVNSEGSFYALTERTERVPLDDLFAFFDSLEAVEPDAMLGHWEGGVFNTGHPGERQLTLIHWAGKSFRGRNDVDPIVSKDAAGRRKANPVLGGACLRAVEYRGVVTATMVYDQHPIFDHFRRITRDRVLGVMDRKGEDVPLFFWLRRV
jgi:hypothetical protein